MAAKTAKTLLKKVKSDYAAIAAEFNATRKYPWKEFKHFAKYVKPGQKILDVGCGNGRLAGFLEEKNIRDCSLIIFLPQKALKDTEINMILYDPT